MKPLDLLLLPPPPLLLSLPHSLSSLPLLLLKLLFLVLSSPRPPPFLPLKQHNHLLFPPFSLLYSFFSNLPTSSLLPHSPFLFSPSFIFILLLPLLPPPPHVHPLPWQPRATMGRQMKNPLFTVLTFLSSFLRLSSLDSPCALLAHAAELARRQSWRSG